MSESSTTESAISVLICDDEELLVKSCGQILSSEGYTVFTEGRGKNALENVRRHRPDIVLTDLMLPDMDGLTLLKEIKKLAPETLVVMITGFATVDSSVEAIRAGAYDYIPKPFTATQLRILIGRAAQQVKLVRDNANLRDQKEALLVREHHRHQRRHPQGVQRGEPRGAHRRQRVHLGRERNGEGADRAGHPRQQPARAPGVRARGLRVTAGESAGVRAVRS